MSAPPKPAARWSLGLSHGAGTALLVSGLVIINHALFIYAQASGANCAIADDFTTAPVPQCSAMGQIPLGGVFEIAAGVDVDYTARGLLATALSALESKECGTSCPEGSATRQDPATLGVCDALRCEMCTSIGAAAAQHCNLAYEVILEHWTYLRSVEFMWKYKGPHHGAPTHPAKPLAAAIFVWSFVWPHLKLLLIHAFFYLPLTKRGRTTGNYWLAVFGECPSSAARARPSAVRAPPEHRPTSAGKWTLMDVLVMCGMYGMFKLRMIETLERLWTMFEHDFVDACVGICANVTNASAPSLASRPPAIAAAAFALSVPEESSTNCTQLCTRLDEAIDATILSPSMRRPRPRPTPPDPPDPAPPDLSACRRARRGEQRRGRPGAAPARGYVRLLHRHRPLVNDLRAHRVPRGQVTSRHHHVECG